MGDPVRKPTLRTRVFVFVDVIKPGGLFHLNVNLP